MSMEFVSSLGHVCMGTSIYACPRLMHDSFNDCVGM